MSKSSWHKTRLAVAAAVGFGLAACSDAAAPQPEAAAGVYLLQSINTKPMPFDLGSFYGYQLEYTSSTLMLQNDNSFQERALVTERLDGNVMQIDTTDFVGVWRQTGSAITLIDVQTADTLHAELKNGLLSLEIPQDTAVFHFVYRKQ